MNITSEQVKSARIFLKWDQKTLSDKAGLSLSTIKRMEGFPGQIKGYVANVKLVRSTLENYGIKFINNEEGLGVVELTKK